MSIQAAVRTYLETHDLTSGTSLEDKITMRLHRWGLLDQQQLKVGRYRLDFAWPSIKVALEADGPHHWRPDVAIKDVSRDAWLRSEGWLVFRVDETHMNLEEQLGRVASVINALAGIK